MAFLFACIAAAGFFAASFAVNSALGRSTRVQTLAMLVSAGILLGIAFADLLPEAFELAGTARAALSVAAGFVVLYAVETLTGGHTHHIEPHADGHGHAHAHAHSHAPALDADGCVPRHAVIPFLIGIGLHNFSDGIVIGASDAASDASGAGVAIGILIHQLPVGLSFGAVLLASGLTSRAVHRDALLIAAMIPAGALLIALLPNLGDAGLGTLIGMAAGALIYISAGHLLPEAHSESRDLGATTAFVVALVATVLFISHSGEHGHDDHDEVAAASSSAPVEFS